MRVGAKHQQKGPKTGEGIKLPLNRLKACWSQQGGKQIKAPLLELERTSSGGGLVPPPDQPQYRQACRGRPESAGGFAGALLESAPSCVEALKSEREDQTRALVSFSQRLELLLLQADDLWLDLAGGISEGKAGPSASRLTSSNRPRPSSSDPQNRTCSPSICSSARLDLWNPQTQV